MAGIGISCRTQWRNSSGQFASRMESGAEAAQEEAGEVGAALAAALAPKRSGALAGSIHGTGSGFATGDLPEAVPQEEGAGPHLIGAGFDKVLVGDDFGPVLGPVLHPGNPAVHFMRDALKLVNGRIMGIIRSKMP